MNLGLKKFEFKPGQSGNPAGRPKKLLTRIDEKCHELGLHPFDEIMKLLPDLDSREKIEVWLQLLSYCQAKPKQSDQEITEQEQMKEELSRLSTKELLSLVKENLSSSVGDNEANILFAIEATRTQS
jgi:hypothetical protein